MKPISRAFLAFILVSGLALVGTAHFIVQVSAQAPGLIVVIGSDTTWTKADSPHALTGPLLVSEGATLTIEAGATVNLNGYEIRVNGTLVAIGSSADQIHIIENINLSEGGTEVNPYGRIEFTQYSNGWNEQTGSGCIFEHVFIEYVDIDSSVSLKINNITIRGDITTGDSSVISNSEIAINNKITNGKITFGDSSVISNNELVGPVYAGSSNLFYNNSIGGSINAGSSNVISNNNITSSVFVGSSSSIFNNTIKGIVKAIESEISNNIIKHRVNYYTDPFTGRTSYSDPGPAIEVRGDSVISNNTITGQEDYVGIDVESGTFYISGNIITDAGTAINAAGGATIEGNLLIDSDKGIVLSKSNAIIRNNTITGGNEGIVGISGGMDIIERNLISNHSIHGINIDVPAIIQNNTITNNTVGIYVHTSTVSINYNNILNNSENSIYLSTSHGVNATYNWWGTTDTQAINLSIRDFKYDFNLGKVTFVPFLTEPNPEAMPIPEFPSWIILPLLLTATLVIIIYRNRLTRKVR
jgi:parallel beta-helix repeat protein